MINDLEKKLFDFITSELENISLKDLRKEYIDLSEKYRLRKNLSFNNDLQKLAYITSRMPATFNSLKFTLNQIIKIAPNYKINSVLDLGSGPGTSILSVFSILPDIKEIKLVEKDKFLFDLSKKLSSLLDLNKNILLERNDILRVKDYDSDLVILSYVANELKDFAIDKIIKRWFFSKSKMILFLEPGTRYGFEKIRYIRQKLIDNKCYVVAPCPNELKCPMKNNDWCHFYVRVKRTKLHKFLKSGTLGYEDEKFSYVIAVKEPITKNNARIMGFTKNDKTKVKLKVCMDGEIKNTEVPASKKTLYKEAKKLNWGDSLNL